MAMARSRSACTVGPAWGIRRTAPRKQEATLDEFEVRAINVYAVPYQANPEGNCPPREKALRLETMICTPGLGEVDDGGERRIEWQWWTGFHSPPNCEKQHALNPGWVTLADGSRRPTEPPADRDPEMAAI